jgi:hypothetical protein
MKVQVQKEKKEHMKAHVLKKEKKIALFSK